MIETISMRKKKSIYGVHPSVEKVRKAIEQLPAKTGRSLDEWIAFIKREGPSTQEERRAWLASEFGLGTNYSSWLTLLTDGVGWEDGDPESYLKAAEQYVEEMYAGAKAGLRPIYDALLKLGLRQGKDVKACPCKTIVPLYRNHVFAEIKPATRTRIDLGFALRDTPATGRLIDTGGFAKKDRITHRIPITSIDEIDDEVRYWLAVAYELDEKG
jgi:hypothetical protein